MQLEIARSPTETLIIHGSFLLRLVFRIVKPAAVLPHDLGTFPNIVLGHPAILH